MRGGGASGGPEFVGVGEEGIGGSGREGEVMTETDRPLGSILGATMYEMIGWEADAKAHGLTLAEWIIRVCNAQCESGSYIPRPAKEATP